MKILLKAFRNGLGALIALISRLIPVKKVKRDTDAQAVADTKAQTIELYQFFACPFCIIIRRVIRRLNINIVTRNAQTRGGVYREEIMKETGKVQVPCLKITENDKVTWMFESADIKAYLEKEFGQFMIYVEGGTSIQQRLAKDLYVFCSQALNIKKQIDVDLKIKVVEHAQAWTDHEGEGKFYIDIDKNLSIDKFITAFCHEMIHVIQHLRDKPISEKEAYQLEASLAESLKVKFSNG